MMKKKRGMFGNVCLLVSILVIYGLLGYKVYVVCTEGIWLDWTLGDYVPDRVVLAVIGMRPSVAKTTVIWFLSQDLLLYLLPFPILLVVLDRWAAGGRGES